MSSQVLNDPADRGGRHAVRLIWPLLLMVVATMLWGLTNVVQKMSLEHLGPFSVIAVRCWLGTLVLVPFALRERAQPRSIARPPVRLYTFLAAAAFCTGLGLQQISAGLTTATNLGFLINSCAVVVPMILWLTGGETPTARVILAALTVMAGAALLSGFSTRFSSGDLLCVASALGYALWTIAVGRAVAGNGFASGLTLLQLLFTALVSTAIALVVEAPSLAQFMAFAPGLLFLGIFGTGFSFALSAHAQLGLSICAAAIVMNLEAVFTAIAGHLVMGDILGAAAFLGGTMILGGCLIVQIRR